jgi:glycosyltransferase involved in cell wall biosynthesis
VAANFTWLGQCNDLKPLYRSAALFVLPSRREGVPNALLEAMSCGLPAIVSDASPGPLEYVIAGETGEIFQSESVDSLADKIEALMSAPTTRARLSQQAVDRVRPLFTSNVMPLWEKVLFHDDSGTLN